MGKYYYKEPYVPNNPIVKYRKCKKCNEIKYFQYMEVNFMCKVCYTLVHNKKRCTKCYLLKPTQEFKKKKTAKDNYETRCKLCQKTTIGTGEKRRIPYKKWSDAKKRIKYYNNKRRRAVKNATLNGFDEEIQAIYDSCSDGYSVDHIIPLNGKLVCGLNVPWNLQIITTKENLKKGNKIPK